VLKINVLSSSPDPFSPNNDARKDTTAISYTLIDNNPADTICLRIYNPPQQQVIRTLLNYVSQDTGFHQVEWDGKTDTGAFVAENGAYICWISAANSFGNSVMDTIPVTVDLTAPVLRIAKMSLGRQQVGLTPEVNEPIESYYVWRSDGNTADFRIISSGVSIDDFLDTSPIGDNQSYYYRVTVSDLAGNTGTSNAVFARMTQDGGILSNRGNFAAPNTIVKCRDDVQAFVTIPETGTFGDTVEFVKIKLIKKGRDVLESEGRIIPVDKKLAVCFEITAKELDSSYNEICQLTNWSAGKPVKLTLHYDSCPPAKAGSLAIYEWNVNQWVKKGGEVNTENQTLTFDTSHFSNYAIMYQTTSTFMGAKPNPFSPNADGINDYVEIRFENPGNREVNLSIFDLPGRLVWNKVYAAGTASVTWDGKDLAGRIVEGGAYIYQVEAGTKVVNGVVAVAK
jgi:flagellar hook assembly protein FlgD